MVRMVVVKAKKRISEYLVVFAIRVLFICEDILGPAQSAAFKVGDNKQDFVLILCVRT